MSTDIDLADLEGFEASVAAPAKGAKPERKAPAAPAVKDKIRILLEDCDDIPPTGLFIGYNGRPYILQTGAEVDVPVGLKEILDNAVITSPVIDPRTRQIIDWRSRKKYNYRVIAA